MESEHKQPWRHYAAGLHISLIMLFTAVDKGPPHERISRDPFGVVVKIIYEIHWLELNSVLKGKTLHEG